jgi:DNA-binding transcriptional LysR family regulator
VDLKTLRAFYFVGKYGGLLKAANYLKVTSPAISVQLKKLEKELHVTLFERRPNRLVLTEKGRLVLKEVSDILESITKLQSISAQTVHASTEKLTIGLGSDLPKFLAPQIASFSRKHPEVQLTIVSRPFQTLSLLLSGAVDVAIGWFPHIPRMVQKRPLFNSSLHLIVPQDHPLARKKRISLEDTASFRLILHSTSAFARRVVDEVFYRSGIEITNALEVGTCESIVEYVRRGVGIGFVHDICLPKKAEKEIRVRDMRGMVGTVEVAIIYKESIARQPSYHALIESLCASKFENTERRPSDRSSSARSYESSGF